MANQESEDNYRSMLTAYDKLEESGQLDNSVSGLSGSIHEESSLDVFMNDPKNKEFLSEEDQRNLEIKKTKTTTKKIVEKTESKQDTNLVDWDLIESLYNIGKSKGYIKE